MMKAKFLILPVVLFGLVQITCAQQKVARKGTHPTTRKKKPELRYTLSQFNGKWQEVKRSLLQSKQNMEFTDTLLLKFDEDKVEIKDATSMRVSMKGFAQMEAPNLLIAGGDEFLVKYLDSSRLILDDGEFVREMQKKKLFYFETLGKDSVEVDPINNAVNIEPKNIEGKWMVYRRQALAGSVNDQAVVIKSLELFPSDVQGSAKGEVVFYKTNITETLPCSVVFGNTTILVITEPYTWEFSTYKADGKEFVFGEKGQLLYYAKKL
jgi:hypothetical protein